MMRLFDACDELRADVPDVLIRASVRPLMSGSLAEDNGRL